MKTIKHLAVVAIIGGLTAGCASAPEGEATAEADDEGVICQRVKEMGSNLPKQVCTTRAEREAMARKTKDEITNRQRGDVRPPPPAPAGGIN